MRSAGRIKSLGGPDRPASRSLGTTALKQAAANFGTNTAARANGIYIYLANSKCVLTYVLLHLSLRFQNH